MITCMHLFLVIPSQMSHPLDFKGWNQLAFVLSVGSQLALQLPQFTLCTWFVNGKKKKKTHFLWIYLTVEFNDECWLNPPLITKRKNFTDSSSKVLGENKKKTDFSLKMASAVLIESRVSPRTCSPPPRPVPTAPGTVQLRSVMVLSSSSFFLFSHSAYNHTPSQLCFIRPFARTGLFHCLMYSQAWRTKQTCLCSDFISDIRNWSFLWLISVFRSVD